MAVHSACPGCHAELAPFDGPTHRYIGASPACWRLYTEFLATNVGHRLAIDAYAAQHPGQPTPQAVQSVAVHLITIDAVLDRGFRSEQASTIRASAVELGRQGKVEYRWLEPQPSLWAATLNDVVDRGTSQADWVESVRDGWWETHGDVLRAWSDFIVATVGE